MTLTDKDRENAKARREAIAACAACDPFGWIIGADRQPIDPARRCDHQEPTPRWWDR